MSATSSTSPTSPTDRRDIRSASQPFKRDKDNGSKWSNGQRPGSGVTINYNADTFSEELFAGSDSQKEKVRPRKQWSQAGRYTRSKTHANKAPKLYGATYDLGHSGGRLAHKIDAHLESTDAPLSRSLLELLPQHVNNTNSSITTVKSQSSGGSEILYSFDNKGPSPSDRGRKVELGGLVEKAEKKWVAEQTEKIVRGEYEVLNVEGESVVMKGKGKKSPRQRAVGNQPAAVRGIDGEDDDGFELI